MATDVTNECVNSRWNHPSGKWYGRRGTLLRPHWTKGQVTDRNRTLWWHSHFWLCSDDPAPMGDRLQDGAKRSLLAAGEPQRAIHGCRPEPARLLRGHGSSFCAESNPRYFLVLLDASYLRTAASGQIESAATSRNRRLGSEC